MVSAQATNAVLLPLGATLLLRVVKSALLPAPYRHWAVRNGAAASKVLLVVRLSLSKVVSLVGSVTIAVHADGVADWLPAAEVIEKAIAKAIAKSHRKKLSQKAITGTASGL